MTDVVALTPPLQPPTRPSVPMPTETTVASLGPLLDRVASQARSFARLSPGKKAELLARVRPRFLELAPRMAELGNLAKGIDPTAPEAGEEWFGGNAISLRALRVFEQALRDIQRHGAPAIPEAAVERTRDGRTRVRVIPHDRYDALLFRGWQSYVYLEAGAVPTQISELQASFYRQREPEGRVVAVLGGGNVGSISVLDVLYHSFVDGAVCVLKLSPVNAYLGPLYERAFQPLIEAGYLGIVYGGRELGEALVQDPRVNAVHITGSIDTHDAIVFGPPGAERERRKRERAPLLTKPITSELGNVSPVLIVPAVYSERELDAAVRNVVGMVIQNASFNCNAAKLLVTARGWPQRDEFQRRLRVALAAIPPRLAYYPGADQRYDTLVSQPAGGEVISLGAREGGRLPWTLIWGLLPGSSAPEFRIEPFCSIVSEVSLPGQDAAEFFRRAPRFLNEEVWGTLNAMWIAPDSVLTDTELRAALDRGTQELRYGTVGINVWPAVGYGLGWLPWGGHPSSTLTDAQSGIGFGHNGIMLERVEKAVVEGPLLLFPEPFYYPGHPRLLELAKAMCSFEAEPSWLRVAGAAFNALLR